MEKLGVQISDDVKTEDKVKIAARYTRCPKCGAEIDKNANVPSCPVHGTEPFEPKK